MEKEKVVLAFSGGLDTSYCVKYLSEECGYDVYTAIANTGGFSCEELKRIEEMCCAMVLIPFRLVPNVFSKQ